jgi:hypothetical protein
MYSSVCTVPVCRKSVYKSGTAGASDYSNFFSIFLYSTIFCVLDQHTIDGHACRSQGDYNSSSTTSKKQLLLLNLHSHSLLAYFFLLTFFITMPRSKRSQLGRYSCFIWTKDPNVHCSIAFFLSDL